MTKVAKIAKIILRHLAPKNELILKSLSLLELRFAKYLAGLKKNETLTVFPIDEKTRPGNFELHFSPTHNINDCFVVSCAIHCSRSLFAPKAAAKLSFILSHALSLFIAFTFLFVSWGRTNAAAPSKSKI